MKRIFFTAILCVILFSSCNKESYNHAVAIIYPGPGLVHYADQQSDSIIFNTFDSYEVKTLSEWMHTTDRFDSPQKKLNNLYYYYFLGKVEVMMEPNATGKCRFGYVSVRSYGDGWDQTAKTYFYQYAWHNITKPNPIYRLAYSIPDSVSFVSRKPADCLADTLKFTTYLDWKIEVPQNSFVHPVTLSGNAGNHTIRLEFDENTSAEDDSVQIKLVTPEYNVTTPILIHRKGLKELKE